MTLAQLKAYNFMCTRCKKPQPMSVGRKRAAGGWVCLPCVKADTHRPAAVCGDPSTAFRAPPHTAAPRSRGFAIGWPRGFESRTSNPLDPCYIGKPRKAGHAPRDSAQFHFNTPASILQEKVYRSHHKAKPADEGYTFRGKACRPRRVWLLLRDDGPADLPVLASLLRLPQSTLAKLLEPAVRCGVLDVTRGKPPVYSIGPVQPKGEA